MKKLILLLFVFLCGTTFALNTSKELVNKKVIKSKFNKYKKRNFKNKKFEKSTCRICCTVEASNGTGMTATATVCSGWLLTSCATAGEKACHKAEIQAESQLDPGN